MEICYYCLPWPFADHQANDDGNLNRPRVGGDIYQSNSDVYFSLADSGIGDGARIYRSDLSDLFADGHDMGLAPGSQTLNFFGLSLGDLFITDFDGTFSLYTTAESLGLRFNDNLDGLDSLAVPEPSALLLLMAGALGLGVRHRKARLKTPHCRECGGTG